MSTKKELYLARNFEELIKVYERDVAKFNYKPICEFVTRLSNLLSFNFNFWLSRLLKNLVSIFENAGYALRRGDEERAFVLFMEFRTIVTVIQNEPDFLRLKQKTQDSLFEFSEICRDNANALMERLKRRYESKRLDDNAAPITMKLSQLKSVELRKAKLAIMKENQQMAEKMMSNEEKLEEIDLELRKLAMAEQKRGDHQRHSVRQVRLESDICEGRTRRPPEKDEVKLVCNETLNKLSKLL